jgi:hypothetical protein
MLAEWGLQKIRPALAYDFLPLRFRRDGEVDSLTPPGKSNLLGLIDKRLLSGSALPFDSEGLRSYSNV